MHNPSLANPAGLTAMFIAFTHMLSFSIVIPGLWLYINSMGWSYRHLGWAFAAPVAGGFICGYMLTPVTLDERSEKISSPFRPSRMKLVLGFFLCLGITGHCLYAFWHHLHGVFVARFLVGCCTGTVVPCQLLIENQAIREDDDTSDNVVLRSRMVSFGAVQALGTVVGLALATSFNKVHEFYVHDEKYDQHVIVGIVGASLYGICLVLMFCFISPNDFKATKKECDCPPRSSTASSRLGIFVPAVIYEHGQSDVAALPDVFSTTVLLVFYFFVNNMLTGIEVLHAPFCVDNYGWNSAEIGSSWLGFVCFVLFIGLMTISLAQQIPCNRRLFGAVVLMFVTYGLQLQPDEPREQYVAFLALFAAAFCVIDFAVTEIYMDKIGEGEPKSRTALIKMEVMSWFSHMAMFTRILGAIVAGYIYDYYSHDDHVSRRPYAIYAPPFAICVVLMGMCVIFYKRFQLRSATEAPSSAEKESMLQPQQVSCMDE
eukprot:TRINITY_DN7984_c0_g1_i4.p1 TRINITY_DN7984_c0_g1~~TRINITY_DN7984_c0_g1_i4.p1  ORF type:complete len:486 (-),score=40.63 TRINITY_DN7984_c0_g1_i4:319-1776(-)